MRLQLILPRMEPTIFKMPSVCPHQGRQGRHFRQHQEVDNAVKDTEYERYFSAS